MKEKIKEVLSDMAKITLLCGTLTGLMIIANLLANLV